MSEFSADWLQLREMADARARADKLLDLLSQTGSEFTPEARFEPASRSSSQTESNAGSASNPATSSALRRRYTEVIDLGSGTGANLRYLAPRLGPGQHWRCIDRDSALLSQLPERTASWARRAGYQVAIGPANERLRLAGPGWDCAVCTEQRDLTTALQPQAQRSGTPRPARTALALPTGGLVTASALLDLVAEDWLASLIEHCDRARCALLFALSYDGRVRLTPARTGDRRIIELVNQHQRGDKGFGAALGPTAAAMTERLLSARGYRFQSASSDWQLGPDQPQLQSALIAGWLEAATELAPQNGDALRDWQRARQSDIAAGRLEIQVGHQDLIALPAEHG
ncbi:class I SAM-dependent methyltransferase [Halochromatium sp.]